MLYLLILFLSLGAFFVESKEGDECTLRTTGKLGRCSFVANCTTLGDRTQGIVCGYKRGKKLICCPTPEDPIIENPTNSRTTGKNDECIVNTSRKPGRCSFISDCTTLEDPTHATVCGFKKRKKLICCPTPQDPVIGNPTNSTTSERNDECIVNTSRKPGRCSFVSDCTTLEDPTHATVCGFKKRKKLICCPTPQDPIMGYPSNSRNSERSSECIVKTSRKPGKCSFVSDCTTLGDPTQATVCGYKNRKKIICCPLPTSQDRTSEDQRKCISERKCREYNTIVSSCNIGMTMDGEAAGRIEFPHMALLGYNDERGQKYWMCGGSLISDQYILTAAHCLHPITIYISGKRKKKIINLARLGEHDYNKRNRKIQDFSFTTIQHPDYNPTAKLNDIALLKVTGKVNFSEFIRPACLPTAFDPHRPDAIITGWGTTLFMGNTSSVLQKSGLEFSSYNTCFDRYKSHGITVDNITQICAVDKESDACHGDSGGPLQIKHSSYDCMYTVVGVSSYGILCQKNIPGVYGRVFSYLDWIENEVW